jgi:hypothetical protein
MFSYMMNRAKGLACFALLFVLPEAFARLTNQILPEFFQDPISEPRAYFAAEVHVTPNCPAQGISRVQARIEGPSSAPSSRRSSFVFVTFMNQQQ